MRQARHRHCLGRLEPCRRRLPARDRCRRVAGVVLAAHQVGERCVGRVFARQKRAQHAHCGGRIAAAQAGIPQVEEHARLLRAAGQDVLQRRPRFGIALLAEQHDRLQVSQRARAGEPRVCPVERGPRSSWQPGLDGGVDHVREQGRIPGVLTQEGFHLIQPIERLRRVHGTVAHGEVEVINDASASSTIG